MNRRWALLSVIMLAAVSASAQSVISTHSGLVYYFEGSVWLGDQHLEQKFGKFPDIGQGGELRTESGRAEVLLTPGVFLRLAENSRIRMISTSLADTRVELLEGSAVVEAASASSDTSALVLYKAWQVRVPQRGIYRIDTVPPQVKVFKGEVEVVSAEAKETLAVKEGQALPFAPVLVAEASTNALGDAFDHWAMDRSQAVYADNATAAQILDDPGLTDSAGLALGGLSYFPMTSPALGYGSPYGLSFWSPFQPTLNSLYLRSYGVGWAQPAYPGGPPLFQLYPFHPGRPGTVGGLPPVGAGTSGGVRPGGIGTTRMAPPARPATVPMAPHAHPALGARGGHR